MKGHHNTVLTSAAIVALCCLLAPSADAASPILSGYGEPGAGQQVILGSHLLNTHRGGGSAGSSGGAISAPAQASSTGASEGSYTPTSSTDQTSGHDQGITAAERSRGAGRGSSVTEKSTPEQTVSLSPASSDTNVSVSGGVLLVVLLVAGALLVVGLVTRRLSKLQP
jgi:cobalamin biosynthesis Mg chelatase CobN